MKTCMEESMCLAAYLLYKMICGVQMSPASRFICLIFPYSDVFHNRLTSRHCWKEKCMNVRKIITEAGSPP